MLPSDARPVKIVKKIVLTGGPCAGNSTALKFVKDHLEKRAGKD